MIRRFEPYAYALLRIVTSALFVVHGLQKLFGMFGGTRMPVISQFGLAGLIETVGGTLVAIGLYTQPVAFLLSGEMAVAYFRMHFPQGFVPAQNGGELAVLYCFIFLYVSTRGAGVWSLDRK